MQRIGKKGENKMTVEREVTSIKLTTREERDLIEAIFEMASSTRQNLFQTDTELFVKTVGNIVKDLREYDEAHSIDY